MKYIHEGIMEGKQVAKLKTICPITDLNMVRGKRVVVVETKTKGRECQSEEREKEMKTMNYFLRKITQGGRREKQSIFRTINSRSCCKDQKKG